MAISKYSKFSEVSEIYFFDLDTILSLTLTIYLTSSTDTTVKLDVKFVLDYLPLAILSASSYAMLLQNHFQGKPDTNKRPIHLWSTL